MRVIHCGACDCRDAFGFDGFGMFDETWQMVHRASGCECTGHASEHNLFAFEDLFSCQFDLPIGIKADEFCCGKSVADLDHRVLLLGEDLSDLDRLFKPFALAGAGDS